MSYTSPYTGTFLSSDITLALKAGQSGDGKSFAIQEETGNYDINSNPTGFGGPNPERADMGAVATSTGVLIEVQTPADDSFAYGLDVPITFVNPGPPNDNVFTINPEDIGYPADSVLPDGIYTVRYILEDLNQGGFLQPVTKYILLAHNAKCKVYNALANAHKEDCCNGGKVDDALANYSMYKSMLYNAAMGRIEKVKEQLECLNSGDCGCGCS
jgi:hypothetical protein